MSIYDTDYMKDRPSGPGGRHFPSWILSLAVLGGAIWLLKQLYDALFARLKP